MYITMFCNISRKNWWTSNTIFKSSVAPYVIEVDSTTGLVKNVGLVQEQKYDIKDAQIKYFLGQFIKNIRELPLDIVIYKQNINTAYAL